MFRPTPPSKSTGSVAGSDGIRKTRILENCCFVEAKRYFGNGIRTGSDGILPKTIDFVQGLHQFDLDLLWDAVRFCGAVM